MGGANRNIVDAGATGGRLFNRLGFKNISLFSWGKEVDMTGRSDRISVIAVAGIGESSIC